MTAIEIVLLVIGMIAILASFVFSAKMDEADDIKKAELTEKQKDAIRKQIMSVFDEQMDELKDKTEIELDKLSNVKMNEMNEYSENILNEINRNHNEVMFLYDMLNEKKKEVKNTVRDVMAVKKEINESIKATETPTADILDDMGFMASEALLNEEKATKNTKSSKAKTPAKAKKEKILDELDGLSVNEVVVKAPVRNKKKTSTAKTAASRMKETVRKESTREENKDINLVTGNNNEKILELNSIGKSNVEIAKELGLGIGEVKLVIDLFRGGK